MTPILMYTLYAALLLHIAMIGVAVWRVWRSDDHVIARLMGADLIATLILAVLVIVSLISRESIYIDVALGLAALGFIGTIALAKYAADEQMF